MLRAFGFRPKAIPQQLRLKLPQVHAFIELAVVPGGPRGSVTVEALHEASLTIQALPGMHAGQTGVFTYQNQAGKFRFSSKCNSVKGQHAVFALPHRIETIQVFSGTQQRSAVRLDATLTAHWRFAHGGKGVGDFMRASLTDISRTGASLIIDRELKKGTFLEVRFAVASTGAPLTLLAEVMRVVKIEASGKNSLGLRFQGVTADQDRAIMEFINKRQAERRSRGLA